MSSALSSTVTRGLCASFLLFGTFACAASQPQLDTPDIAECSLPAEGQPRAFADLIPNRTTRPVDGVPISTVRVGGPAYRAGLREGDILERVGSRVLDGSVDDFYSPFRGCKPGTKVEIQYTREGISHVELLVLAGDWPPY